MEKTITISQEFEKDIVKMCNDELNYHINESGCVGEYESEIKTQIKLLRQLGYTDKADYYEKQFYSVMESCVALVYTDNGMH